MFGEKYYEALKGSSKIKVVLNTALVNAASDGTKLTSATVRSEGVVEWKIEANYFAMCLGGIENSRILLWLNEQNDRKFIKDHDGIGRYWMEHPTVSVAEALVYRERADLFTEGQAYFALGGNIQKKSDYMNVSFDIDEIAYPSRTKQMIADVMYVAHKLVPTLMGAFNKNLVCGARLHAQYEQAPDPDNRVMLDTEKDSLGIPKTILKWEKKPAERRTIVKATKEVARQFAEQDL